MKHRMVALVLGFLGLGAVAQVDAGHNWHRGRGAKSFAPVGLFKVPIPGAGNTEIVDATPDGMTLVYTNARGRMGIVDITDPSSPTSLGETDLPGSPTSVAVAPGGDYALCVVRTSVRNEGAPPVITAGRLVSIDLSNGTIAAQYDLPASASGYVAEGPDSIAVTEIDGDTVAVIAIENEPIVTTDGTPGGDFVDDDAPGNPNDISDPGFVLVLNIVNLSTLAGTAAESIEFNNLNTIPGTFFPDDPQPEFVSIHDTKAAVTVQENNVAGVIDFADPMNPIVLDLFSMGAVDNRKADLMEDEMIAFDDWYPGDVAGEPFAGARIPDGIAWSPDGQVLYTADEGEQDFTGGRGFSAWTSTGSFLWDDGGSLEKIAVTRGHYPEGRSEAKGVEMEGTAAATYGDDDLLFLTSERGSFLGL